MMKKPLQIIKKTRKQQKNETILERILKQSPLIQGYLYMLHKGEEKFRKENSKYEIIVKKKEKNQVRTLVWMAIVNILSC